MSLDVTLYYEIDHKGDITDEWEARHEVFSHNITHNLAQMAAALGCYEAAWRPDEISSDIQAQAIEPILREALAELIRYPSQYKQYEPKNGWGDMAGFKRFLEAYIKACEEYPHAKIHACR